MADKRFFGKNGPRHSAMSSSSIGERMRVCTARQRGMPAMPLNTGVALSLRRRRRLFSISAVGIMISAATASTMGGSAMLRRKVP